MLSNNIIEIIFINFTFISLSLYSIILSFYLIEKFKNKKYTNLYKCQPKRIDYSNIYCKLKICIRNILLIIIFNSVGLYYFRNLFINNVYNLNLYEYIKTVLIDIGVVLLFDDFLFYLFHRLMHYNKWLFNNFHSMHHEALSPLPIDILYVSIPELFFVLFSTFLAILIRGGILPFSFVIFTIIKQLHEISIHSGIKSIKLIKKIPFYGTNEHHDNHHKMLKGNYASTFNIWDKIFNTEI